MLRDQRIFFQEFRRNFHSTGSITPSSPWLGAALARFIPQESPNGPSITRRILEVGPGTGAVTRQIVRKLLPADQLDLVELNDSFVACLRERFARDPDFSPVSERARVLHQPIESLTAEPTYDLIISGLPLNNFAAADVERIVEALTRLLKPGGTLSFFEYMAVRKARTLISGGAERSRLNGISACLNQLLSGGEIRCDWVWANFPPAWVHHVQPGGK
jgi:phospholipid N-methyltransferase